MIIFIKLFFSLWFMTTLIALLSTGKGTWSEVMKLMNQADFEKIILVTNNFGKERFSHSKPFELIVVDFNQPIKHLIEVIRKSLSEKIDNPLATEVALNLSSGNGKEHMALLSAVLKAGLGLRLVVPGQEEVEEL